MQGVLAAGGAQEALTELYTEQLRTLTMLGTPKETAAIREAVRKLRDTERAPPHAPKVHSFYSPGTEAAGPNPANM